MSLVLVSHSAKLAEGLREMVDQVAGPEVAVAVAAGTGDGRLGTSAPLIADALRSALDAPGADGVVVLLDLGSAALSLEIALDELTDADRARVRVSNGPLVEGAIVAAVQASVGASVDDVTAAATQAGAVPKFGS